MKGIEPPNLEIIRTLGEKYLGLLEAETIKQIEMKEKANSISKEENFSKSSSEIEISSKQEISGQLFL